MEVVNTRLKWDGTILPYDVGVKISAVWQIDKQKYWTISLPSGYILNGQNLEAESLIYGIPINTSPEFNCMVDMIKPIFGIASRGSHLLKIGRSICGIYQVPLSDEGNIIVENDIKTCNIAIDSGLKDKIQRMLAFCELLVLAGANERNIRMRVTSEGLQPVLYNGTSVVLRKAGDMVFNVLAHQTHMKWFGEDTSIAGVLAKMIDYRAGDNMTVAIAGIRDKLTGVISGYSRQYIWMVSFITSRLTAILLTL